MQKNNTQLFLFVLIAVLCSSAFLLFRNSYSSHKPEQRLTVYCAHDAIHAKQIFDLYFEKTGQSINVLYDAEASKSLGLIEQLKLEKNNPRCDVFWNNELLGMLDLKQHNVLHPYAGPGYKRIPKQHKDPDAHWTGFAARMRVWIFNKQFTPPDDLSTLLNAPDLSRAAIAKPLYGTTLTHYTILHHIMGEEQFIKWHDSNIARGLRIARGNSVTKDLVAQGVCNYAWTDTDDFFVAKDNNQPVFALPATVAQNKTSYQIVIPNTIAIIKGTPKIKQAQQFVDFLLSEELEIKLANSRARQIPLGHVDPAKLPPDVANLKKQITNPYPIQQAWSSRQKVIDWLKSGEPK